MNKKRREYKSRINNLSQKSRSQILEEDINLFRNSLKKNGKEIVVSPDSKLYFDGMLKKYGKKVSIEYEISDKNVTGINPLELNGRLKERKRSDDEHDLNRVGILWSTGLDSTVLKEKLNEKRNQLRIINLYCFFFTKANERKGSNRERKALENIKKFQKYNPNKKSQFLHIIELNYPADSYSLNLFNDFDKHSFVGHNQCMLANAVKYSIEKKLGINKFYFDVDMDHNDCFCDTEEAYLNFQEFISKLSHHTISLERFRCVENCDNYLLEKRRKIDYLKGLGLFDKISFCYASSRYHYSHAKSLKNGVHYQSNSCGQCKKCKEYYQALQLKL